MKRDNELFVHELLEKHAGLELGAEHAHVVEARLDSLAKLRCLDDADALVLQLRSAPRGPLLENVIEALTTHETSFFRDAQAFGALSEAVLPELVRRREAGRCLSIWSAGCSTGQEAYSIALLLREKFPLLADWHLEIWGTDVSRSVVERAREGVYGPLDIRRGLSAAARDKYFTQSPCGYRVSDAIRRMVTWRVMNLCGPWLALPTFDLVLMRNVLIYFSAETRARVLSRTLANMASDGYLMLGVSETTFGTAVELEPRMLRGALVYQRKLP